MDDCAPGTVLAVVRAGYVPLSLTAIYVFRCVPLRGSVDAVSKFRNDPRHMFMGVPPPNRTGTPAVEAWSLKL